MILLSLTLFLFFPALSLSLQADPSPLHIPIVRRANTGARDLNYYAAAAERIRAKYNINVPSSSTPHARRAKRASSSDISITNQVSFEWFCESNIYSFHAIALQAADSSYFGSVQIGTP